MMKYQLMAWCDSDECEPLAQCPKCSIDSVIGSSSGYTIELEFLKKCMNSGFHHQSRYKLINEPSRAVDAGSSKEKIIAITNSIGLRIDAEKAKSALLAKIQTALEKNIVAYELLVDTIACHLYLPDIFQHIDNLPDNLKASIKGIVQECRYPD